MSLTIVSSASAEARTISACSRCSGSRRLSIRSPIIPITPFRGVRISWLMLARNIDFAALACSAACRSAKARFACQTSPPAAANNRTLNPQAILLSRRLCSRSSVTVSACENSDHRSSAADSVPSWANSINWLYSFRRRRSFLRRPDAQPCRRCPDRCHGELHVGAPLGPFQQHLFQHPLFDEPGVRLASAHRADGRRPRLRLDQRSPRQHLPREIPRDRQIRATPFFQGHQPLVFSLPRETPDRTCFAATVL